MTVFQRIPIWGNCHKLRLVLFSKLQMRQIPVKTREQLIDEFGELDRQVTQFAPVAKRHRDLAEQIRGWYQEHPANQPAVANGYLYEVQVSACGEERVLDLKAKREIWKRLKIGRALELFSITLKAVEAAPELGKELLDKLAQKKPIGSRKLIVVAIAPAQAAVLQKAA